MRRAVVATLLIALCVVPASGTDTTLSARLRREVATALEEIGLRPGDLVVRDIAALSRNAARWRKTGVWQGEWPMPTERDLMRPALIDRALRRPLEAMSMGVDLAQGMPPRELRFLLSRVRGVRPDAPPKNVKELVEFLEAALGHLRTRVRDRVVVLHPRYLGVRDWILEGIDEPDHGVAREVFEALADMDWKTAALEARALAEHLLRVDLSGIEDWPKEKPLRIRRYRDCDIVIGTPNGDVHEGRVWFLVDPGGDDVYVNAGGGAQSEGAGLILDLAGDDRYVATEPGCYAAGILGVGLLVDRDGDDLYESPGMDQAAAIAGVGILLDGGGADEFVADRFAQGAAAFGYALLRNDGPESDVYVIQQWGQGFGRTAGTGILEDVGGDDRYVAGTKYPSEMYSQWTGGRKVHWSFAQGCGLGYYGRFQGPDGKLVTKEMFPGGVGLLLDHAGHDSYDASMYGQGTAYFYGLGMLIDRAGNDRYRATWYGQGAAPHYAAGILVDAAGDDIYEGMNQVQGNGRDFSAAVFVDLAGNDRYYAEDRAQGCGDLADGYGLFIDVSGNDVYEATRKSARGFATERRPEFQPRPGLPYHDVGVFLDLGGKDVYRGKAKGADGTTWIQNATRRGVGIDR